MRLKAKDYIYIILVFIGFLFFGYQKLFNSRADSSVEMQNKKMLVVVGEARVIVRVAQTTETKYEGLGSVEQMDENEGMLFVHDVSGRHGYSMRDMLFDLDFIFIENDKVVDIARGISQKYKGTLSGGVDYNYVLEVNADWAKRNDINIGDKVEVKEL